MKIARISLFSATLTIGCAVLIGACSSSSAANPSGGSGSGGDGGGGGGGATSDGGTGSGSNDSGSSATNALDCHSITWCTDYSPTENAPANIPALNGGTIPDGFYRSEEGGNTYGFLFQGSQVLEVFAGIDNQLGTYTINGGTLSINTTVQCSYNQADKTPDDASQTYSFAVQGKNLFLKSPTEFGASDAGRRFELIDNPNDVCTGDADYACTDSSCTCSFSVGTALQACD
jgi:hypothetical protein